MKSLDEYTNVYLYEEQSEDHHFGLGFDDEATDVTLESGELWRREYT